MESTADQLWFLCKHEDGSIFGPLPFAQVRRWAATAQVAPHDTLSQDQQTWLKAPMFPELEMDWLVEVASESYYGPTTLGALKEFLRLGEIGEETFVINSCDGSRQQMKDLNERLQFSFEPEGETMGGSEEAPIATRMALEQRDRISDLEQSLFEERLARQQCEARCRELEARFHQW